MSGHLLHVAIACGRPVYRVECIDRATCDMPTHYEDPAKANAKALVQILSTEEGRKRWYAAETDREREDLLRDEWAAIAEQRWPWVKSDPVECWGEHANEFYDECETFADFDWPGEITGPIRVSISNGGDIEEFMPEVTVVAEVPA